MKTTELTLKISDWKTESNYLPTEVMTRRLKQVKSWAATQKRLIGLVGKKAKAD